MPAKSPTLIPCASKLHLWSGEDDARKCCNGWTRLYAPFCYGSMYVDQKLWYEPGHPAFFSPTLVPDDQREEIQRLRDIVPLELQDLLEHEWLHVH